MFRNRITLLPVVLVIVVLTTWLDRAYAESQEVLLRRFSSYIEPLLDANNRRSDAAEAFFPRLWQHVLDLHIDRGIIEFVDTACGIESTTKRLSSEGAWREWLRGCYSESVFNTTQFKKIVIAEIKRLDDEFTAIDNKVLVESGVDVEFVPDRFDPSTLRFDELDKLVDESIEYIAPQVGRATAIRRASQVFGFLAGELGSRVSGKALSDKEGKLSWPGYAGTVLVDMGAGEVASRTFENLSGEVRVLRQTVTVATTTFLKQYLFAGKAREQQAWQVVNLFANHEASLVGQIIRGMGVDPEQATAAYMKARQLRYQNTK